MADKTYKNLFDDGYTTYHDDGSKSTTYKNLFDDGYTTYHENGGKSTTYKNILDDGYTTYHRDGSKSSTYGNILDDGYTTYHSDGSKSSTYGNLFDNGYTTYHSGGSTSNSYGNRFGGGYTGYNKNSTSYYGGGGFTSSTAYSGYSDPDKSSVWALIIGLLAVFGLAFLYAGRNSIFPFICFAGVSIASVIMIKKKKGRQYVWAETYISVGTAFLILTVNNYVSSPKGLLIFLYWIAPVCIGFAIGFMDCLLDYEDKTPLVVAYYILMGASWFCCIYKNNYHAIYQKCVAVEWIILLILTAISFYLGYRSEKKHKR